MLEQTEHFPFPLSPFSLPNSALSFDISFHQNAGCRSLVRLHLYEYIGTMVLPLILAHYHPYLCSDVSARNVNVHGNHDEKPAPGVASQSQMST